MVKMRVYELAKELNLKSKTLLDKLKEMNIPVGSHVSSLDGDVVSKIKANLSETPAAPEARLAKPTVIRRPGKPSRRRPLRAVHGRAGGQRQTAVQESHAPPEKKTSPLDVHSNQGQVQTRTPSLRAKRPDTEIQRKNDNSVNRVRKKDPPAGQAKNADSAEERTRKPQKSGKTVRPAKERPLAASKSGDAKGVKTEKRKRKRKKKKVKREMPAKIIRLPELPEPGMEESSEVKTHPNVRRKPVSKHPWGKAGRSETESDANVSSKESAKTKRKRKKPAIDAERNPDAAEPARKASGDKKPKDAKWAKKKISFKRKEVVEGDALYAGQRRKSRRGGKVKAVKAQKTQITTPKAIKRRVKVDETIILSDLAKRMGIKAGEMIKKLMMLGVMATVNQTIDFDTAVLVASEFGYEVEKAAFEEDAILNLDTEVDPDKLRERSPVVTIMGHVDHGKTSLLDVIRETRVTENEAGGITQHIGAYSVNMNDRNITFLDTPGHEAFTAMRARGAKITDLVVLVVAADDGVMPQTIEAINHSKAAGVPIIVAVNKIDKANADTDRVYRELSEKNLVPEDWGGDTIFVQVSAKQNQGIDTLLEMILLQAELLELKANPDRLATGYVVESKLDSGRGAVATVLVQEGTLQAGTSVVCGIHHGRIRALLNDRGDQVNLAGPSAPVELLGLSGVPNAGDELIALEDERIAKQVSEHRVQKQRSKELATSSRMSLEKLFEKLREGEVKDLNLILRADVHGSIEALRDSLVKLSNEEVCIHVIHSATGTITESDVSLATVSDAIIIGFNVRPSPKVQAYANEEHVDMRFYNVIYNVIKDIQDAILGMMDSTYEERLLGRAEIRDVFHIPKVGAVAGCYVTDGKIQRGQLVRLVRDGVVHYDGKLASLRRFKDDVKEVQTGYECGMGIENYNDLKVGDIMECYYMEEIKPELKVDV